MSKLDEKRWRDERYVLAAVGLGGSWGEVEQRTSKKLSRRDFETALRRLEDGGAINRDGHGRMTRDIQAWATMRRNRSE